MFKFICRTLHHFRSSTRASRTHNLCCFQNQPFSSSLESIRNSTNQNSFTVTYLVNSCGFSPEKALTSSKYVKFETPDNPDSVLAFFENHGFAQTQISTIVRTSPQVLLSDPEKTLLPKLEFLKSKGFSSTDVARIVSATPDLLKRSLERTIIPSFDFFSNLLQSEEKFLAAIKRYGGLLVFDYQTHVAPSIEILREAGVPSANIMYLLLKQPRVFMTSSDRFRQIVEEVENMGFNPLRMRFVKAVHALRSMNKSTWEKKVKVYKKWGWTEDEILGAFKRHEGFMVASEDKIMGIMDFIVNKMGWESSLVARSPEIMSLSLEKRIVPRSVVYQALLSKRLIKTKDISVKTILRFSEMEFLSKVKSYNEEEATELLKLYKENCKVTEGGLVKHVPL